MYCLHIAFTLFFFNALDKWFYVYKQINQNQFWKHDLSRKFRTGNFNFVHIVLHKMCCVQAIFWVILLRNSVINISNLCLFSGGQTKRFCFHVETQCCSDMGTHYNSQKHHLLLCICLWAVIMLISHVSRSSFWTSFPGILGRSGAVFSVR